MSGVNSRCRNLDGREGLKPDFRYLPWLTPVTICIGALCDADGGTPKKAITLSDRMVTYADLTVAFEHDTPKIDILSSNCLALSAGSAVAQIPVYRAVATTIPPKASLPISEIVDKVKEKYREVKLSKIEDEVFKNRGLTMAQFYQNQQSLDPDFVAQLDAEVEDYRFDLSIIVAGVDSGGGHLYLVYPPLSSDCFDGFGYVAIGTGERHSESVFIARRYTSSTPFRKALCIAYEAKKRAEIAVGVGKQTDAYVVDGQGVHMVSSDTLKAMDELYNQVYEIDNKRYSELDNAISKLNVSYVGGKRHASASKKTQ